MQDTYNEQTNTYEYPASHYNTNLKPENTKSWELGVNAKFLGNRINLDMTFYRSNTFNQTFYVDASASSGYKNNVKFFLISSLSKFIPSSTKVSSIESTSNNLNLFDA